MDLVTGITSRASALKLAEPGPSSTDLDTILKAAVAAPDHGRLAPWRFVVIAGAARHRLSELFLLAKLTQTPDASPTQLDNERQKAFRAPTVIVAAAHITKDHKVPEVEQVVAVGAAVQNMLLAAYALGYGTMWRTGPAAYLPEVKRGLGLEEDNHIVGFVYVGTTSVPGQLRPRSFSEETVRVL